MILRIILFLSRKIGDGLWWLDEDETVPRWVLILACICFFVMGLCLHLVQSL